MADITVDVNLPSSVSVDVTSPTQVLATNVSIPGPQGPRGEKGNPTSINSLTAENIIITGVDGNIVYNSGLSTIFISGNSGYFQSAVNSLTTNLNSTGANLNISINNLSGLFTGYTGTLDATYATDSQLANTGSTLNTKIDNLSGYVNSQDSNISNNLASTGSSLQSNINTLSSNLSLTGSNLNDKINSLSGTLTGNYLTTNSASSTYATITNLNSTGNTLNSNISALSGTLTSNYATINNLALTGSNLNTKIDNFSGTYQNFVDNLDSSYATDVQLQNTGSTLSQNINSLSGTLTGNYYLKSNPSGFITGVDLSSYLTSSSASSTYATIINLASTGSTLTSSINSLNSAFTGFTGNLDATYATDSQLVSTGSTLVSSINSLSGTLTSNYATINNLNSTGSTLETSIASTGNTLNLSINSLSGTLTSTYATITNLASTGSTLNNSINSLSGTLTSTYATINNLASTGSTLATNLANTGSNLDTKINVLSGSAVLLYGNQTINGLKDFTTRPTVNTTPVLLSGESANGLSVLVKNDDSVTLNKGQPVYIYGANGNNILVRKAVNTGEATSSKTLGLLNQSLAPNAQGLVVTEGALEGIDTNAGNAGDPIWLGPTGNLIFGLAQKPYAPNHLVYLGVIERKQQNNGKIYVKVQNGFELEELHNVNINHKNALNDNDIIRYNSASGLWFNETLNTGIFQTQINSLSGSSVLLYGNQSVGGIKTFRDNVYINNLFVTGTETIVSTNNFNVQSPYLILNLTGGAVDGGIFFVTGSGLTGVNDNGPIIGFDHSNKFKFGISTRNSDLSTLPDIASFQDITAYSGFVDGKYSTIINLASTGSTLSTNLASTGSTLQTNINNLSNTYATITNLASTGSTLVTNLASTGSTLDTKINTLSGYITGTNSTFTTNLASTGSTLNTRINNLSGYINSPASNIVFTTGNQTISGVKTFANGSNQILNTTYSTLTGLKAISGLLSGQLYRISDFVLKWNNQSYNDQTVKTAASGEPLIVTALSNKQIYHLAQSEIYPQDTIYYNIDAIGSYSWGTINNNVSIPDFKGWIYRRVDNLLNIDIPYDWRNITVNCCKPDVSSVPNYFPNVQYTRLDYVKETGNNSNRGKLYYSNVTGNSGNALNNNSFWSPVSAFVESGTFFSTDEGYGFRALYDDMDIEDFIISLPALISSRIQQPTFTSTLTGLGAFTLNNVKNIKIEGGYSNVIVGSSFYNNTIGNSFYNNTIGNNFYDNTIGSNFFSNTIGNTFAANIIGTYFYYNTIENGFYDNTIGNGFNSNTIGNTFFSNTIGATFFSNTIGNSFGSNSISDYFNSNSIRNGFNSNIAENNFNNVDFSSSTHVYNPYNTTLFQNSASSMRLRYFNSSDQLVVTDPTA